jgi:hypothetical protein
LLENGFVSLHWVVRCLPLYLIVPQWIHDELFIHYSAKMGRWEEGRRERERGGGGAEGERGGEREREGEEEGVCERECEKESEVRTVDSGGERGGGKRFDQ